MPDFRPAFAEILVLIREETRHNFEGGHDPDGVQWLPITPYTEIHSANPDRDPDRPLIDTGELMLAALWRPDVDMTDTTLTVGTPVPYAGKHQRGGWSESGHLVPRRRFRGWSKSLIADTKKVIARHAAALLKAR